MFFTVQYVLLEQIICDVKRGEGGVKVNVTMTLRIMILICEQPLTHYLQNQSLIIFYII